MSLDPRAEELLFRYPDQLEESDLAELRALAEGDLLVAVMMDSIHEAEALLHSGAETVEMSAQGHAILEEVVAETLSAALDSDRTVEDIMAPLPVALTSPVKVPEEAPHNEAEEVVFPPDPRAARSGSSMWRALAALLGLGAGYGLWASGNPGPQDPSGAGGVAGGGDDLQMRGGDRLELQDSEAPPLAVSQDPVDVAPLPHRSELVVTASADGGGTGGDRRLHSGAVRPSTSPIEFEAVLKEPRSLALIEAEAEGNTRVVYPPPGGSWDAPAGGNALQLEGAELPDFLPKSAGLASYILVGIGAGERFEIEADGSVESVTGFLASHRAEVIDRLEIRWVDPK